MAGEQNQQQEVQIPEGQTLVSIEELNLLQSNARRSVAIEANVDLDNPMAEMFLDQIYKPGMTAEEMKPLVEQYNIGVPVSDDDGQGGDTSYAPPADKVTEVTGSRGQGAERNTLATGTSVAGNEIQFGSAGDEAQQVYKDMTEQGATAEDARVAAMDTLLKRHGEQSAYQRIKDRQNDEARVAAVIARQEANRGVGNA